jgi:hypothetical protein
MLDSAATDKLLDELATKLKPTVDAVEASLPTTRHHYGDYLSVITTIAAKQGDSKQVKLAIGIALQRAGADKQGVYHALRAMGVV